MFKGCRQMRVPTMFKYVTNQTSCYVCTSSFDICEGDLWNWPIPYFSITIHILKDIGGWTAGTTAKGATGTTAKGAGAAAEKDINSAYNSFRWLGVTWLNRQSNFEYVMRMLHGIAHIIKVRMHTQWCHPYATKTICLAVVCIPLDTPSKKICIWGLVICRSHLLKQRLEPLEPFLSGAASRDELTSHAIIAMITQIEAISI